MWFWFLADPNASGEPGEGKGGKQVDQASEAAAGQQGGQGEGASASASSKSKSAEASAAAATAGGGGESLDDPEGAKSQPAKAESAPAFWEEPEHNRVAGPMWVALPWMTSLLLHVAVIVLGIVLIWSQMILEEEQEAIIPVARMSEDPGGALDQSEQLQMESTQDVREVDSEEVTPDDALEDLEMTEEMEMELVGVSAGGGGALAPFGTTSGGGPEMGAEFYGAGGNAERVAYVIDASGSMIDTLPFVLEELRRSVNDLSDQQEFTVVFYQRDVAIEVPPEGWKTATNEMKRAVTEWIAPESGNVVPRGPTNPQPALNLVMRYNPQLVFVLSDNITGTGQYEINRDDLLASLRSANRGGATAINTIQFMYPDPLNTLEQIAEDHDGVFRFITEADLGLR